MTASSPNSRPPYGKPWLSYADQVAKLAARGLTVTDQRAAERFLSHASYYRFSGYCLAFEQTRHVFFPGTTFDDVRGAYDFDVTLRDLLTEALEVIEIDVRANVAHHFGQRHGAFGHTDPAKFYLKFNHAELMSGLHDEAERSSELFTDHFRSNYAEFPDLPVWILTEIVSFGTLTRMYRGMLRADQQAIVRRYGLQPDVFGAVLLHLRYVRNLCAHHSRLWDRVWSIKPTLPSGPAWIPPSMPGNDRLFSTLCLTYRLLRECPTAKDFAREWRNRLHVLIAKPPNTQRAASCMGLPATWQQHSIWK